MHRASCIVAEPLALAYCGFYSRALDFASPVNSAAGGFYLAKGEKPGCVSGSIFRMGIDLSENMLAESEALLEKEGLRERVDLMCGDVEQLPYEDASMDGIFMSFTLELFDTPEFPRVRGECRRVLRPGGRLVDVSVSKWGKPGLILEAFEWMHRHFPNLMDYRDFRAESRSERRIVATVVASSLMA